MAGQERFRRVPPGRMDFPRESANEKPGFSEKAGLPAEPRSQSYRLIVALAIHAAVPPWPRSVSMAIFFSIWPGSSPALNSTGTKCSGLLSASGFSKVKLASSHLTLDDAEGLAAAHDQPLRDRFTGLQHAQEQRRGADGQAPKQPGLPRAARRCWRPNRWSRSTTGRECIRAGRRASAARSCRS